MNKQGQSTQGPFLQHMHQVRIIKSKHSQSNTDDHDVSSWGKSMDCANHGLTAFSFYFSFASSSSQSPRGTSFLVTSQPGECWIIALSITKLLRCRHSAAIHCTSHCHCRTRISGLIALLPAEKIQKVLGTTCKAGQQAFALLTPKTMSARLRRTGQGNQ